MYVRFREAAKRFGASNAGSYQPIQGGFRIKSASALGSPALCPEITDRLAFDMSTETAC